MSDNTLEEHTAEFNEWAFNEEEGTSPRHDLERVDGYFTRYWDGVRKCCSAERIALELKIGLDGFKNEVLQKNPGRQAVAWGHNAGSVTCHGSSSSSGRKCQAVVRNLYAWVDLL